MKLIYIAGPYRGATVERTRLHIEAAKHLAALVTDKGWYPVVPHLNTAEFELICPWLPDQFFLDGTLELMRRCDAVALVPGYESSEGTKGEIAEARRINLKIYFSEIDIPLADHHVPPIPKEAVAVPRMPEDLQESKE